MSNQKYKKSKIDHVSGRIIKKNLIYIIGLSEKLANQEVQYEIQVLSKYEYLGQYGKVLKVVVNKPFLLGQNKNQFSVYVTFQNEKEGMICRLALEDFKYQGCHLKASFGTTKYCQYFISKQKCLNSECLYLHDWASASEIHPQVIIQYKELVQFNIKQLQQQQQEYFIKNLQQIYNQRKGQIQQPTQFLSFQGLVEKYVTQYNIDLNVIQKKEHRQETVCTKNKFYITEQLAYQEKQQKDLILTINNQDSKIDFQNDLDKSIVLQFLSKTSSIFYLDSYQQSRYNFVSELESTIDSKCDHSSVTSLLISVFGKAEEAKNNTNKIQFEVLSSSGKLCKSLNKRISIMH